MKILQINPIAGHSSTGRAVSELDKYFIEHRHESFVACIDGYNVKNIYKIGNTFDRKIHSILTRLTGYEACFSNIATKKFIKYIDIIKPDIIKLNIVHSNYINYFMLLNYISQNDIPLLLVLDDCWHFTGKCVHYTTNICYKWKQKCGECPNLENGIPSFFFDRTKYMLKKKKEYLNRVPRLGVVGVSDWITNEAKQSIIKNAKIIKRIYNWVDLKEFYPKENRENIKKKYNLKNKFIILGVASDWDESKGISSFIKLSHEFNENYKVVLVGKNSNNINLGNIYHIAATYNINELAEIYSMADVFVTFSKEESFGKVSAEALACGTPVICYNSTACPELIGEKCGKVIQVDDYNGILKAINDIAERPKEFYSPYCVKYANDNFKFEKSAQEYLDTFEELINE